MCNRDRLKEFCICWQKHFGVLFMVRSPTALLFSALAVHPGQSEEFFFQNVFIYLVASGLSCNMWDLLLWYTGSVVGACGLSCTRACGIFVPSPGIEPTFPCIARWILNHWTTRKVPGLLLKHSKPELHSDQWTLKKWSQSICYFCKAPPSYLDAQCFIFIIIFIYYPLN